MSRLSGPEQAIADLIRLLFRGARNQNSIEFTTQARLKLARYSWPTRTFDVIYQNTSGVQRLCMVSILAAAPALAGNTVASCVLYVGATSPPTNSIARGGLAAATRNDEEAIETVITFIVDVNEYYKLTSTKIGGTVLSMLDWVEVDLRV